MKPTQIRFSRALALFALLLLSPPPGLRALTTTWPNLMNYQGQLTNPSGVAVANGAYSIAFNIYSQASAGSSLWSETQVVTATAGLFNVVLGSVNPLSNLPIADYGTDLWIGITVASDPEMTPRQQLLPSAYAKNAQNSQELEGLVTGTAATNIVALDATGHVPAGLVQSGSLTVPYDLTGNSASYNLNVSNTSATTTALGMKMTAANGISATASSAAGFGIWGMSSPADTANAIGVIGSANNGTGVLAESNNGIGISITSASTSQPALISQGSFPAKFIVNSAVAADAAVMASSSLGGQIVNLVDRGNNASVYVSNTVSGDFGVSATASGGTGVFGRSTSGSSNNYGVWGDNASGGQAGVYGTGEFGVEGNGSLLGVYGIGSTYGVYGQGGTYGVYATGSTDGVYATGTSYGVYANSSSGTALYGTSSTGPGVVGQTGSGTQYGVSGTNTIATAGSGVFGSGFMGVLGQANGNGGAGVEGQINATFSGGYGVLGTNGYTTGVAVQGNHTGTGIGVGVEGSSTGTNGIGVEGNANYGVEGNGSGFCGVCAYNTANEYGLYAQSAYDAIWAVSNGSSSTSYGIYAQVASPIGGSASGYFDTYGGGSALTYGIWVLDNSTGGYGVYSQSSNIDYYSVGLGTYGFYLSNSSPPGNAVGVFSADSCTNCYSGEFVNTQATSGAGAALFVQGRVKINGPSGSFSVGTGATSYTLSNPYWTASSVLILRCATAGAGTTWPAYYITSITAGSQGIIDFPTGAIIVPTTFYYVILN